MSLFHVMLAATAAAATAMPTSSAQQARTYLPGVAQSKLVTVTEGGPASASVTVLTQAIATKETGPEKTIGRFGEVYAFSPSFIAVRRDEPTSIRFWNLQPDDQHDFMLTAPDLSVLMHVTLPPLKETSFIFTFHQEGLFNFYCTLHQPEMSGQILVLPPRAH